MAIELSVGDKGAAAAQSGGGPHRVRPRARRIGWGDFRATAAALTAFAAIGIAIALCQTALAQATALLIAFAAAAAGLALGFLLGLPPGPAEPGSPESRSAGETHLETIADWLTKVLVGAGLVQLQNIPAALRDIALVAQEPGHAYLAPAVSLIVGFGVWGFFGGYLATRLFLNSAFRMVDGDAAAVAADDAGRIAKPSGAPVAAIAAVAEGQPQ